MTREQMIAWLTLEGWGPMLCANAAPAWLKGRCCVFLTCREGYHTPTMHHNLQWLLQGETPKPCELRRYTDAHLSAAVRHIQENFP